MKYLFGILSVVVLFPVTLQSSALSSNGFLLTGGTTSFTNELFTGDVLLQNVTQSVKNEERVKKSQMFLAFYDKKIKEAKANTSYQQKLKKFRTAKYSTEYPGPDWDDRAYELVQLYKILSKNSTISETSFPGVAPGQEERYRKIYHNCIIAEDIVYTYYLYLDTAYLRGVDPTDGKYLLSDRAKALLEMANEAIIVRDFPTYFGAVDEIKNLINTYCRSRKISASYQLEFTVPAGI